MEQLALEKFKKRENTTFAVVFTFMPDAGVVEKKEKGIVKMNLKTGLERGNGKGLERRTGIGIKEKKETGIGMERDWEDDGNRNEETKGKEIRVKDGNLDWKEGRKYGLKRRKGEGIREKYGNGNG